MDDLLDRLRREGRDDDPLLAALVVMLKQLQETLEQLRAENAELKRLLFGRSTERIPPMDREVKRRRRSKSGEPDPEAAARTQQRRRARAKAREKLVEEEVVHPVDEAELRCPHCGGTRFGDLGEGEVTFEYDYVPPRFVRRKHVQRKKACRCGSYVVTAPAPPRVVEGSHYGPGLHAQVVVAKCADALPLHRQARQLERAGVPMGRSTLGDLFHRCGSLLTPLRDRLLQLIRQARYVNADETRLPVLAPGKTRNAYIWTFIADEMVAFRYSASRSGQTPVDVLGDSPGVLQVDAYSGYNQVCTPAGRERAGCWAHMRRYAFKALETAPAESRWLMNRIVDLYEVEYRAAEKNILGTDAHRVLRRTCSRAIIDEIELFIEQEAPATPPKSPLGAAFTHAKNNWKALTLFLDDPTLALDNNISERALRIVALGRKNFLFVGNDEAGDHLAVLQSLVSSCQLVGVNPFAYLKDVLIRIQHHPQSRIDELLPHNWAPADSG